MEPTAPHVERQPLHDAATPVKRRRTAAVTTDCCRTCRLRKVKCSGNPGNGSCSNCSRLELQCSFVFPNGTVDGTDKVSRTKPSQSHTEAGTLRKRAQRACKQCHAHKTKCSGDLPQCKRCDASGLACEYIPAKRKFASVPSQAGSSKSHSGQPSPGAVSSVKSDDTMVPPGQPGTGPEEIANTPTTNAGVRTSTTLVPVGNYTMPVDISVFTAEEMLMRKDFLLRHVDAYFEHIYWLPSLGFLHPITTYEQIEDGTMSPVLAAAICSVGGLFYNPGHLDFSNKCTDQVELHLFRNIYHFNPDCLILYALSGAYNFFIGAFAKVWQCFGVATRLMLGMQANWDVVPQKGTFAEQETLRRVAWELFNLDRLLAGGYDEYISCRVEHMKIRLPCDEASYRDNIPVVAERIHDKPKKGHEATGIHGHQIRVLDVKHRIQVVTRKLEVSLGPSRLHIEPSQVMADINGFQNELSRIIFALPDDLRLNDQNITKYVASPQRFGYVYLQTHLAASHVDLYRFALPGIREKSVDIYRKLPREFITKSQKQAVAHAICLARFCDAVMKEVDLQPKSPGLNLAGDFTIVHIVSQCLRVLLIAWQHELYHDLQEHTTAPLWRNEPADEAHVRFLIDVLLKISEPWGQILAIAGSAHEKNKKMVQEFYKTRIFHDVKGTQGFTGPSDNTNVRLPGAHFILDHAYAETPRQEQKAKSRDPLAADRWFNAAQLTSGMAFDFQTPKVETDVEHAPPGVPMFLAHAIRPTGGPDDGTMWYDPDDEMIALSTKMWQMSELNAMMPGHGHLMASDTVPIMPLPGASDQQVYSQAPSVQPLPHQFIQPPHTPQTPQTSQAMFMSNYPPQYHDNQSNTPHQYMQQHGFG